MKKFINISIIFILTGILFTNCSKVAQNIADNIEYKLEDVHLEILQNSSSFFDAIIHKDTNKAQHATLYVDIRLTNFNNIDINIDEMDYKVFISDQFIGAGQIKDGMNILSNKSNIITIPLTINILDLMNAGINLLEQREVDIFIKGSSTAKTSIGDFIMPFELKDGKSKIGTPIFNMN